MMKHSQPVVTSDNETTDENELIERFADWLGRRGLSLPAVLMMETARPLSFLSGQLMIFMEPMVGTFHSSRHYDTVLRILEDRDKYAKLVDRIEANTRKQDK